MDNIQTREWLEGKAFKYISHTSVMGVIMSKKPNYISVSLPAELIEDIDQVVGSQGYRSRADVVTDAIRRHLEKLKKEEPTSA